MEQNVAMEQETIQINVFAEPKESTVVRTQETRPERLNRIKKRKQSKARKQCTEEAAQHHQVTTASIGSKTKSKEKLVQQATTSHAAAVSKFSSLFKNNPEIPQIPEKTVEIHSEKVFSGRSVKELHIHPYLVSNLAQRFDVTDLTAVQIKAIPHVLAGRDVMIKSQTGSGKTFCYALPLMQQLQSMQPAITRASGTFALVIVPTRELALQSYEVFDKLCQAFRRIVPGTVMGGESKDREKKRIRKGINILVGTPGRLCDHLQTTKCLSVASLRYVVVDEADRLLDMGFERDVKQILSTVKEKSAPNHVIQTVLLSATLSQRVETLAGLSLKDPIRIHVNESETTETQAHDVSKATTIAAKDETFATPESLKHYLVVVPSKLRLVTLAAFILWKSKYTTKNKKMVVFLSTQDSVEFHSRLLSVLEDEQTLELYKLHGDMPQKERTKVFNEFSSSDAGVLLSTDVAARGLDLPRVRWIVQYNTPGSARDYIHRVGRTARIGAQGHALLFLSPAEVGYVDVLRAHNIRLHELQVDDILKTLLIETRNNRKLAAVTTTVNTVHESATSLQRRLEEIVQSEISLRTLARKAYQSFVRSYATYSSDVKHIFHVKSLHLGHVAKSFALNDKPTNIGDIVSRTAAARGGGRTGGGDRGQKRKANTLPAAASAMTSSSFVVPQYKRARIHTMSEFASGLDDAARGDKTKRAAPTKPQKTKHVTSAKTKHVTSAKTKHVTSAKTKRHKQLASKKFKQKPKFSKKV